VLGAVSGDVQLDGWQLEDLAIFRTLYGLGVQIALALRALVRRHFDDLIGTRTGLQMLLQSEHVCCHYWSCFCRGAIQVQAT